MQEEKVGRVKKGFELESYLCSCAGKHSSSHLYEMKFKTLSLDKWLRRKVYRFAYKNITT